MLSTIITVLLQFCAIAVLSMVALVLSGAVVIVAAGIARRTWAAVQGKPLPPVVATKEPPKGGRKKRRKGRKRS